MLFLASLFKGKNGERVQGALFVGPAVVLLAVGLDVPRDPHDHPVPAGTVGRGWLHPGQLRNDVHPAPDALFVLRNTVLWVILVPLLATAIGLIYAFLVDRARGEEFAKALVFLPMAISMVGACIIWKFVYDYRPTQRDPDRPAQPDPRLARVGTRPVPAHRAAGTPSCSSS